MPRRSSIGEAPAARLRRPSLMSALPRTVAVVVPSPAISLVLTAISLSSCAPMFSKGSANSRSRAMVTPSLMISGAPNFLSMTTLRPRGPRVTDTTSATPSTPRRSAACASLLKSNCLADIGDQGLRCNEKERDAAAAGSVALAGSELLGTVACDNREDVLLAEDQVLDLVDLDLAAGVLRVHHPVADLDVELDALAGLLVVATAADRLDRALLGLEGLDDDAICQGAELQGHGDLPSDGNWLALSS